MDASGHGNGNLDTQLLIDGKTVKGQGGSETIVNPATGKKVAAVPSGNKAQLDQAVKAAQRAFEGWSQSTPQQRSLLLQLTPETGVGAAVEAIETSLKRRTGV